VRQKGWAVRKGAGEKREKNSKRGVTKKICDQWGTPPCKEQQKRHRKKKKWKFIKRQRNRGSSECQGAKTNGGGKIKKGGGLGWGKLGNRNMYLKDA